MSVTWGCGPTRQLTPRGRHRMALVAASVAGAVAMSIVSASVHSGPTTPEPSLVRYEDGSGVLYVGDTEVATYPADTFVWHCSTMGDHICGPGVDDADISVSSPLPLPTP